MKKSAQYKYRIVKLELANGEILYKVEWKRNSFLSSWYRSLYEFLTEKEVASYIDERIKADNEKYLSQTIIKTTYL